ncbi:hypothetical protein E2C01_084888 [Portunus trituberculatus]|uniref:Uncharacterized protein n=1 Tax=Portunus trituberculatus TaxID=210409 RepID=A0A5B7JC38_PORTR|nr:hypothetical protein [Portunus trituberculatus]
MCSNEPRATRIPVNRSSFYKPHAVMSRVAFVVPCSSSKYLRDYEIPINFFISVTGEAKQRALKAEEEARLAKEAGESPPVKPNVEILSLDASLSGPIASLQEGVISGMEVQNTNGALLTSRPDHLQFTYAVQVDGEEPARRVGQRGGAWAAGNEGKGGRLHVGAPGKKKGRGGSDTLA